MTVVSLGACFIYGPKMPDDRAPVLQVCTTRWPIWPMQTCFSKTACSESAAHKAFRQQSCFARRQVWLQAFAWSEKGHRRKLAARERMESHCSELRSAPMVQRPRSQIQRDTSHQAHACLHFDNCLPCMLVQQRVWRAALIF